MTRNDAQEDNHCGWLSSEESHLIPTQGPTLSNLFTTLKLRTRHVGKSETKGGSHCANLTIFTRLNGRVLGLRVNERRRQGVRFAVDLYQADNELIRR